LFGVSFIGIVGAFHYLFYVHFILLHHNKLHPNGASFSEPLLMFFAIFNIAIFFQVPTNKNRPVFRRTDWVLGWQGVNMLSGALARQHLV
jgi:hypothetical protein